MSSNLVDCRQSRSDQKMLYKNTPLVCPGLKQGGVFLSGIPLIPPSDVNSYPEVNSSPDINSLRDVNSTRKLKSARRRENLENRGEKQSTLRLGEGEKARRRRENFGKQG